MDTTCMYIWVQYRILLPKLQGAVMYCTSLGRWNSMLGRMMERKDATIPNEALNENIVLHSGASITVAAAKRRS